MKSKRQIKLLEIIEKNAVETQEELAEFLRREGFDVTQATVSRDIKELRLSKTLDASGRYRYSCQSGGGVDKTRAKLATIFRECVTSIDYARNIVVIKTLTGLASGAAAAIDAMHISHVVGTIAGDDTIMIVFKTDEDAQAFSSEQNENLNREEP